jgi:hypothetical protein
MSTAASPIATATIVAADAGGFRCDRARNAFADAL